MAPLSPVFDRSPAPETTGNGAPATTGPRRHTTPIKKSSQLERQFSTLTRYRDPTLSAIGQQMTGCIVGPMPVPDFLGTFLPTSRIPCYQPTTEGFREGAFRTCIDAKDELGMYGPFIKAIEPFAQHLHIVDSHAEGDPDNGYTFTIKPDISIYPGTVIPRPTGCDSNLIKMHVEFKRYTWDNPFFSPKNPDQEAQPNQPFVGSTQSKINTLGQIGAYTAAQLGSQFHTHCFSVFIMYDFARIIRWDREGAIVMKPIYYDTDPALVEFFSRFSQAPPALRGVDTTVSLAPADEAALARGKLKLSSDIAMFKTSIPGGGGSLTMIIFPRCDASPTTPACRGTRTSRAYDLAGDRVVFFKDSWRIEADDILPEGRIYAELNAQNVPHVPVCLAYGDVASLPEQRPQTSRFSTADWACRRRQLAITAHIHSRHLLDIVGQTLSNFSCTRELVQAVHDAVVAHKGANKVGFLHRDLSPGNIIIFEGCGYLIDWDMAKPIRVVTPRRVTRTGTWQFMSAHLVENRGATHTFQDDLESSFWVLLWTVLMYCQSSLSIEARSEFIRRTFELGGQEKRSVLLSQIVFKGTSDFLPHTPTSHDTISNDTSTTSSDGLISPSLPSNDPDDPAADCNSNKEPILFPNQPLLHQLLKDLADLFRALYWEPLPTDKWVIEYATGLKEGDPMRDHVEKLSAFHHQQSIHRLQDHQYVIDCLAYYLKFETWSTDDKAVPQELTEMKYDVAEGADKVVVFQSKHICQLAEEVERDRKKARLADD